MWFTLSGYVGIKSNRYWSTKYPHVLCDVSLHDFKVWLLSAFCVQRIIGLAFFHKTVGSECYVSLFLSPFYNHLTDEEALYGHFMKSNATACKQFH